MPIQSKQQPPYYEQLQPIKQYIALLNQTATNPPTATILLNTIGTITYQYTEPGAYQADTFEGEPYFTQNKTTIEIGTINNAYQTSATFVTGQEDTSITIKTWDTSTETADGYLNNTLIKITVYP